VAKDEQFDDDEVYDEDEAEDLDEEEIDEEDLEDEEIGDLDELTELEEEDGDELDEAADDERDEEEDLPDDDDEPEEEEESLDVLLTRDKGLDEDLVRGEEARDGLSTTAVVPEGGEFLLVEARSGKTTSIDSPPAASPDGRRFVTASLDLVAGHSPNRLRIYHMELNGPVLEWEHAPREWGARNPRWLDPRAIELERGVVDWNTHELFVSPMVLRQEPGGWSVQPSAEYAADALLSFFSALANELYPEAVRLYGGSYEILRGWNPDQDPADLTGLWQSACRYNGLQCLGRAEIVRSEQVSPDDHRFVVRMVLLS
jgi:hypothetical protein